MLGCISTPEFSTIGWCGMGSHDNRSVIWNGNEIWSLKSGKVCYMSLSLILDCLGSHLVGWSPSCHHHQRYGLQGNPLGPDKEFVISDAWDWSAWKKRFHRCKRIKKKKARNLLLWGFPVELGGKKWLELHVRAFHVTHKRPFSRTVVIFHGFVLLLMLVVDVPWTVDCLTTSVIFKLFGFSRLLWNGCS